MENSTGSEHIGNSIIYDHEVVYMHKYPFDFVVV